MSDFAGGAAGLAAALARLVQSPRVQYVSHQFQNTLPMISGPFSSTMPQRQNARGASPILSGGGVQGSGNAFGSILGSAVTRLNGGAQQDPMQALYAQLLDQLQQPVSMPTGIDTANLMNQVKKAINPIYDAREASAKNQAATGTKEVQGMYKALADDYKKLAPEQLAQAKAAQDQVEQLYGQLRSNIEGTYSRVSKEQGDLFKQLGIESALPDVLGDQQQAVTDATTAASENEAQQAQRYMDIGQTDAEYYREGSPNAIMTGNEVSSQLLADLQDYLQQTEAERASGIQTGYLDQLGQAQSQLGQQQQAAQSEAARRQEMLWQMLQGQMKGSGQQQALNPDTFMAQLPPQQQQAVAGAFTQLQRSPEAVYGKVQDPRSPVPGTFVPTTPQWYMQQADQMLQSGQIDPVTHQALLMYLQLYFGNGNG